MPSYAGALIRIYTELVGASRRTPTASPLRTGLRTFPGLQASFVTGFPPVEP